MAHYQTQRELPERLQSPYKRPDELVKYLSERVVMVADNDWETNHWAWMGFESPLAIGCGCPDCADLIYEVLLACRREHGFKEMP